MSLKSSQNESSLLYLQAKNLFEKAKIAIEDGSIKTETQLVHEVFQAFGAFFESVGKPNLQARYAPEGSPPWSEDYNDMMDEIKTDLEMLYAEVELIGSTLYTDFNHNTVQYETINTRYNDVLDKMKDLELYSGVTSNTIQFGNEDFLNSDKIDFSRSSLTPADISNGVASLPIKSRENISPKAKVSIIVGNTELGKHIIGSASNGFPGNNTEIYTVTDGVLTTQKYTPTFIGDQNNHGNYGAIIDNNANTWFEYERVNVREHDKVTISKNLGWNYQVHGSTMVEYAGEPDNGSLKLQVQIVLEEEKVINQIFFNMYTPPNYGAKTAKIVDILVTDGRVPPHSIVHPTYKGDSYNFNFEPVSAKIVYILFEQPEKYATDVGHIYYEKTNASQRTGDYALGNEINSTKYAQRIDGPAISLNSLGVKVSVNNTSISAEYPLVGTGDVDGYSLANILNELSSSMEDKDSDIGIEKFEGWRWCIGIRDIEIYSCEYEDEGEIVSKPFNFDKPIEKITLDVGEILPKSVLDSFQSKYDYLKYYVSIDDGGKWHPITPMNHEIVSDDQPPKIYTVHTVGTDDMKLTNKTAYLESNSPVYNLRLKIVVKKPETVSTFSRMDVNALKDKLSPVLEKYTLNIKTKANIFDSEESYKLINAGNGSGSVEEGGGNGNDPDRPPGQEDPGGDPNKPPGTIDPDCDPTDPFGGCYEGPGGNNPDDDCDIDDPNSDCYVPPATDEDGESSGGSKFLTISIDDNPSERKKFCYDTDYIVEGPYSGTYNIDRIELRFNGLIIETIDIFNTLGPVKNGRFQFSITPAMLSRYFTATKNGHNFDLFVYVYDVMGNQRRAHMVSKFTTCEVDGDRETTSSLYVTETSTQRSLCVCNDLIIKGYATSPNFINKDDVRLEINGQFVNFMSLGQPINNPCGETVSKASELKTSVDNKSKSRLDFEIVVPYWKLLDLGCTPVKTYRVTLYVKDTKKEVKRTYNLYMKDCVGNPSNPNAIEWVRDGVSCLVCSCESLKISGRMVSKEAIDSIQLRINGIIVDPHNLGQEPANNPCKSSSEPKPPTENCRVFFTGWLAAGRPGLPLGSSKIWEIDKASEYVGQGEYPDNQLAFPKAIAQTFDGVAIGAGTKLEVWGQKNFAGSKIYEIVGPAVINNLPWTIAENEINESIDAVPELASIFPINRRFYVDLGPWNNGSIKITCGHTQPSTPQPSTPPEDLSVIEGNEFHEILASTINSPIKEICVENVNGAFPYGGTRDLPVRVCTNHPLKKITIRIDDVIKFEETYDFGDLVFDNIIPFQLTNLQDKVYDYQVSFEVYYGSPNNPKELSFQKTNLKPRNADGCPPFSQSGPATIQPDPYYNNLISQAGFIDNYFINEWETEDEEVNIIGSRVYANLSARQPSTEKASIQRLSGSIDEKYVNYEIPYWKLLELGCTPVGTYRVEIIGKSGNKETRAAYNFKVDNTCNDSSNHLSDCSVCENDDCQSESQRIDINIEKASTSPCECDDVTIKGNIKSTGMKVGRVELFINDIEVDPNNLGPVVPTNCGSDIPTPPPPSDPPPVEPPPVETPMDCRVHFCGNMLGGADDLVDYNITEIWRANDVSEIISQGAYPNNRTTLPQATKTSIDAIAVGHGVRLEIWSEKYFKGEKILDVVGPLLLNSTYGRTVLPGIEAEVNQTIDSNPVLSEYFPMDKRRWIDMEKFDAGSTRVSCESTPTLPERPSDCRVHIAEGMVGGEFLVNGVKDPIVSGVSHIWHEDEISNVVGAGSYPNNYAAFPKGNKSGMDGIAVGSGTRLEIWSEKNFAGDKLIDIVGPAIINTDKIITLAPEYERQLKKSINKDPILSDAFDEDKMIYMDLERFKAGSTKISCDGNSGTPVEPPPVDPPPNNGDPGGGVEQLVYIQFQNATATTMCNTKNDFKVKINIATAKSIKNVKVQWFENDNVILDQDVTGLNGYVGGEFDLTFPNYGYHLNGGVEWIPYFFDPGVAKLKITVTIEGNITGDNSFPITITQCNTGIVDKNYTNGVNAPNIDISFLNGNTPRNTEYWHQVHLPYQNIPNRFWEGRNAWVGDLLQNAPSKIDTNEPMWDQLYYLLRTYILTDSLVLPEPFSKFESWWKANMTKFKTDSKKDKAMRGTVYATYKLKHICIVHDDTDKNFAVLADGKLEELKEFIKLTPSFTYHWIDFNDINADPGTVAWVQPANSEFLAYMNVEESVLSASVWSLNAYRHKNYTVTKNQDFGEAMLYDNVSPTYNKVHPLIGNATFKQLMYSYKEGVGLLSGGETIVHEVGHAVAYYATDAYPNKYPGEDRAFHDWDEWRNTSGWPLFTNQANDDALLPYSDAAGKATSKFTKTSSTTGKLPNGKEAPVSPYGCRHPSEDFAEAYAMYRVNPTVLKDLYPNKYNFMETWIKNMPRNPGRTSVFNLTDNENVIVSENGVERRHVCDCKMKLQKEKESVTAHVREYSIDELVIKATPRFQISPTSYYDFNWTIPYWKLIQLGLQLKKTYRIKIVAYSEDGSEKKTYYRNLYMKDCTLTDGEPPYEKACHKTESVIIQYYNAAQDKIVTETILASLLPYQIDNGAGTIARVCIVDSGSKGVTVDIIESGDESGYAFQLWAAGVNYYYFNDETDIRTVWSESIYSKTETVNETLMIGDPLSKSETTWLGDLRLGNFETAPSLAAKGSSVNFKMPETFRKYKCDDDIDCGKKVKPNPTGKECNEVTYFLVQYYSLQSNGLRITKLPVTHKNSSKGEYRLDEKTVIRAVWKTDLKGIAIEVIEAADSQSVIITAIGLTYTAPDGLSYTAWSEKLRFYSNNSNNPTFVLGESKKLKDIPWISNGIINYAQASYIGGVGDFIVVKVKPSIENNICSMPQQPPLVIPDDVLNPSVEIYEDSFCVGQGETTVRVKVKDQMGLASIKYSILKNAIVVENNTLIELNGEKERMITFTVDSNTLQAGDTIRIIVKAVNIMGGETNKEVVATAQYCESEPPVIEIFETTMLPSDGHKYCYSDLVEGKYIPVDLKAIDDAGIDYWSILVDGVEVMKETQGSVPRVLDTTLIHRNVPVTKPDPVEYQPGGNTSYVETKVDIVFIFDTSGSMSSYLNNVKNNLNTFKQNLINENIDAYFGYVDSNMTNSNMHMNLTPSASFSLDAIAINSGNWEPFAWKQFTDPAQGGMLFLNQFRPGAKRIFIGVTDTYMSAALNTTDCVQVMKDNNISVHMIHNKSGNYNDPDYQVLADETGGKVFDIKSTSFGVDMGLLATDIATSAKTYIPDYRYALTLKVVDFAGHETYKVINITMTDCTYNGEREEDLEGNIKNDYNVLVRLRWGATPSDVDLYLYLDQDKTKKLSYGSTSSGIPGENSKIYQEFDVDGKLIGQMYLNKDFTSHDSASDYDKEYEFATINGFRGRNITVVADKRGESTVIDTSLPPKIEIVNSVTKKVVYSLATTPSMWSGYRYMRVAEFSLDENGFFGGILRTSAPMADEDPTL